MMKRNKFTWIVLWIITARFIPIALIGYKYKLFQSTTSTGIKIGVIVLVLFIWLTFTFWGLFKEWILTYPDGIFRELLHAIAGVGPYLLLWFIGILARNIAEDFAFVAFTLMLSQLIGVYFKAHYKMLHRTALKARGYVDVIKR